MLKALIPKNKLGWLFYVVLFTVPTYFFLISHPGQYYNMHDDMQMIRQLEFENCIQDGQIPCRWNSNMGHGYGYPLFNFYPPLPYIVGQVFRTFQLSFVETAKLVAVSHFVLTSIFMFILASSIFGNIGGFISALFFSYAPYHALNIYVRGAYNEAWAAAFFPLVFYFSRNIILHQKNRHLSVIGLALAYAGIFLSHNPMAMTFAPALLVWIIFWLFQKHKQNLKAYIKPLLRLLSAGAISLGLSAFFTLPVIFESSLVQIETMFQNYYSFQTHFTTIRQLFFSNYWGDGASIWGPGDGMSFMIGFLQWMVPSLTLIFFGFNYLKHKKINKYFYLTIMLVILSFFYSFLTHERSAFIWTQLSILQKIQFPWRLLNQAVFLFSLAAGSAYYALSKLTTNKLVRSTVITLLLLSLYLTNISFFKPFVYAPLTDQDKFSGFAWTTQITSNIYDYLPKTASKAPDGPAGEYIDQVSSPDYELYGQKKGTDWMFFNIKLANQSSVTIARFAFPELKVFVNNAQVDYKIEPVLGRVVLDLEPGNHVVYLKLYNTPIRTISNYISLITWSGIVIYCLKPLWKKPISRN